MKEWRKDNKTLLAKNQAFYRKRYPHIIAWRSVLYSTLKRLNTKKEGHTIDMLGYSALDLKYHIDHGEWHIDHIRPVTKFSNDALISEVCALDNLQPLWGQSGKSGKSSSGRISLSV